MSPVEVPKFESIEGMREQLETPEEKRERLRGVLEDVKTVIKRAVLLTALGLTVAKGMNEGHHRDNEPQPLRHEHAAALESKAKAELDQAAAYDNRYIDGMPVKFGDQTFMPSEMVQAILQSFPENVENQIDGIYFVDKHYPMEKDYGIKSEKLAICATLEEKSDIFFYAPVAQENLASFFETLGHEIAHANDWETDKEMTPEQRAWLKDQIIGRLHAKDRFRSTYVESIHNDDKNIELHLKAKEYWADIYGRYNLSNPSHLPAKDREIIKEFLETQHLKPEQLEDGYTYNTLLKVFTKKYS